MLSKELQQNLTHALTFLGITPKQRELYLLSLSHGPSSVLQISELLSISRPNVYKLIDALDAVGLSNFSDRTSRKKKFSIAPPTKLLQLLDEKKEAIQEVRERISSDMPELLGHYKQGERGPNVRILSGKRAFRDMFFQVLDETNSVEFCGSAVDFMEVFSASDGERWRQERLRKDVELKLLVFRNDQISPQEDADELRVVKNLKDLDGFTSSFLLAGDRAVIWQPESKVAILIEDQSIVKMMKSLFTHLWHSN